MIRATWWTGPVRWEQDSRSSVVRTDAISDFAPQIACQNPSLRDIQDSKTDHCSTDVEARPNPEQGDRMLEATRKKEICATWEFGSVVRPLASQPIDDITPRPSSCMK